MGFQWHLDDDDLKTENIAKLRRTEETPAVPMAVASGFLNVDTRT